MTKTASRTVPLFSCLAASLIFTLAVPSFANAAAGEEAGKKLFRGVVNVSTGWIEVFQGIYDVSVEKDPITGILYGPFLGLGMAIVRTGSGIYEAVTFPFPFPARYRPMIDPEYVWDNWELFGGLERFIVHKEPEPSKCLIWGILRVKYIKMEE